jgi:hypothetical protein
MVRSLFTTAAVSVFLLASLALGYECTSETRVEANGKTTVCLRCCHEWNCTTTCN